MFSDLDPLEQDMGLRCEDMTPQELVTYIKAYQHAFGREMAVEGFIERSIFKSMQKIYGQATAGKIVKWVFYRYHGVYAGEPVTFTAFTKGRKWWVDKMHLEMQDAIRKEKPASASRVSVGAMKLSDL